MSLISIQEYSTRYNVSKQSVYARIKSGSIQAVIKDGVKMIQDDSQDKEGNFQPIDKAESIHIKAYEKEIKRLKKEVKQLKKDRVKSEDRIDRFIEIIISKKEIPMTTGEIVDVAMIGKKKKKKKKN